MKLLKFDDDATGFEKFITYFVVSFVTGWFLFLFLSIWGVIKNNFTATANAASAGMHTIGFIMLITFILSLVGIYFDKLPMKLSNMGQVALVFCSLLLSIAFYFGWWVAI